MAIVLVLGHGIAATDKVSNLGRFLKMNCFRSLSLPSFTILSTLTMILYLQAVSIELPHTMLTLERHNLSIF